MSKNDEINYLRKLGPEGIAHASGKPYSDINCWMYLIHIGNILALLPPPPCRILDLGVGTGWTSLMLAKIGYQVVGVDISEDMINIAKENQAKENIVNNLKYIARDYEELSYLEEFDCAIFYDCLHHSYDEEQAIRTAFRSLRPGGCLMTHEPGCGHSLARESINAVSQFGVTEKDMPPFKIINSARRVGFQAFEVYGHSNKPNKIFPKSSFTERLNAFYLSFVNLLLPGTHVQNELRKRNIVLMIK